MTYEYECPTCKNTLEVIKPVSELERQELCPTCLLPMERLISRSLFSMGNMEAQYNWAFGKVIHNKRELKNAVAEHEDKKGVKLVEVGTDNMSSIKKQRQKY